MPSYVKCQDRSDLEACKGLATFVLALDLFFLKNLPRPRFGSFHSKCVRLLTLLFLRYFLEVVKENKVCFGWAI